MQAQAPDQSELYTPCVEYSVDMQPQDPDHIEIPPPWIAYHSKKSDQAEAQKDADLAHEILLFLHG